MRLNIQKVDGTFYDVTNQDDFHRGIPVVPHFGHYTSAESYEKAGLKGYEPMTAKEIDTEEQQDEVLRDNNYVIEEKFDGTRALLYFLSANKVSPKGLSREDYLLRYTLQRGSNVEGGRRRIYEYFISHSSNTDRANFLKDEYGIGGSSQTYPDKTTGQTMFSGKGYEVQDDTTSKLFSWSYVASTVADMIETGEYYAQEGFTRCFSRRVSEKTKWYCENTDSLPQLRGLNIPALRGTVIDGEMFIPDRPFKDVSSTLNCNWDKAIDRQLELGYVVFHAFDILFYKGIDLRKMPLKRRKVYLQLVINAVNSPYVEMVSYQTCGGKVSIAPYANTHGLPEDVYKYLGDKVKSYPNFAEEVMEFKSKSSGGSLHFLTPRAFYEYIVATGGEGVMVKPLDGKYYHKRGREYQKIKKFLTREVIIMGFTEPTDDYKGKFPTIDKWDYWETVEQDRVDLSGCTAAEREQFKRNWYPNECRPISKFYCYDWVGTIRFGVAITPEEMNKLPKNKKFNIEEMILEGDDVLVLEVGECSGFDEDTRKMFSEDPKSWVGKVIEVKANEIFRDTGKLRHPRYLRVREDKAPTSCTYHDHISD